MRLNGNISACNLLNIFVGSLGCIVRKIEKRKTTAVDGLNYKIDRRLNGIGTHKKRTVEIADKCLFHRYVEHF